MGGQTNQMQTMLYVQGVVQLVNLFSNDSTFGSSLKEPGKVRAAGDVQELF